MKIALYSVNVGGYDRPLEPEDSSYLGDTDVFMFTDTPFESSVWKMKELPKIVEDERKTSRYPKINSHIVLPDYDYTIYFDSNMFINKSPEFYIEKFLQDKDIALHNNPYRSCLYEEAKEIRDVLRYEKPEIVDAEMKHIREDGYPEKNGLSACHLIVRKNTDKIQKLNDVWWSMVHEYSYRDQLSFNYACWKTDTTYNKIKPYKEHIVEIRHKKKKVTY